MADLQLPDLTARLRLDTTELDRAVSGAARKGSAIGSAIGTGVGSLASGGLQAATAAVSNFVTGSVDSFAELEDATAAAGVLFGDNVKAIEDAAAGAAQRVGLSQQQFIDAAGTFGTFGKAAGLQGPALSDFATKLSDLSGDMASFKGTSTEQAIDAVGAALRGETEPIRAYGVLLDEATIAQEAQRLGLVKAQVDHTKVASAKAALGLAQQRLNKVMHDSKATDAEKAAAQAAVARGEDAVKKALAGSTPELTKQQKLMATQSAIVRQTADAQGDFARTSDSTANTQKRLAAESANVQAQLGAKLAPAMTALRQALLDVITGLSGVATWIQTNIGWLAPLAGFIAVATIALNAHAIATRVVSAATRVWTAVQAAFNLVMSLNPIGIVVIAIAAFVAAVIIAYNRSATFRAIVQAAFAGIRAAITGSMNAARAVVAAVMAFIHGDVTGKLGAVRAVVGAVFRFVTSFIGAQLAAARAIISGVLNVIVGLFTGDFGRAKQGAITALRGLLSFITLLPRRILSALGNLGGLLLNAGRELMDGLTRGITEKAEAVVEKVRGIAQRIKDFFPGSPVRTGPLTAWNNGRAGRQLGDWLAGGLDDSAPGIAAAAERAADAARVAVQPLSGLAGDVTAEAAGAVAASGLAARGPATQLVALTPDTIAALAAAMPDTVWQVLLDSEPIAARVDEKLGRDVSALGRAGG